MMPLSGFVGRAEDILLIGAIVFALVAGSVVIGSKIRERGNQRRIARIIERKRRERETGRREPVSGQK